jgi:predicted RNase H-like nuclease (RuvC/YqgF family)
VVRPVTQPSLPASEVGKAAAFEQAARKAFDRIRAELKKVDEAFEQPFDPRLCARRKALTLKGQAAFTKWQDSKRAVEAAVARLAGSGSPPEQTRRLMAQLHFTKERLGDVERRLADLEEERAALADAVRGLEAGWRR